ncbi:MAG: DUF3048 domain-containing protein [Candidatus Saccharimonadales bacterium]
MDDFRLTRAKPKHIQPLQKPQQKSIHELAAEHDAAQEQQGGDVAENTAQQPQEVFKTPEEVAAAEPEASSFTQSTTGAGTVENPQTSPKRKFPAWHWPLNKKWTIVAVAVALLLIGGSVAAYVATRPQATQPTVTKKPKKPAVAKVTTVASTLSGLQVDPSVNQRPVTGVMIENSQDARPQSGLDQAGVVFEAIAEGGITRFLALYQDTQPDYLGPVRSARPYYVQWCMGFDCALAHAGGSPEALSNIRAWGTKDLDQFSNSGPYQRISSRYAPHNLYSSIAKLNELEASKGFGAANFTGFTRKTDTPYQAPAAPQATAKPTKTPAKPQDTRTPASVIDVAISSGAFNSHLEYDTKSNSYLRSQAGAPHMVVDAAGAQKQLNPKNVVALVMEYGLEADDSHSRYTVTGTGQAFIFLDGTVTTATWSKAETNAPLQLLDAAGKPIPLNAGQTWFTAVSAANLVTYR